jgi:DNA-binding protein HU-beta
VDSYHAHDCSFFHCLFKKYCDPIKYEKVSIVGFGNFSISHRKATVGRNPRTGESIQIPASKRPKFTVGKALKDAVNI